MRKFLFVLMLSFVVSGCVGKTAGNMADETPQEVLSKEGNFVVWDYADRHYVTGTEKSSQQFAEHHHLSYTKTILGAGPHGETVVFEVNKKDPEFADRLVETYNHTVFPIESKGDNYSVYKYNSRIYVIGNPKTRDSFVKHHHLPYTKTLLGAGPYGETVIFEVDKKDPKFVEMLMEAYKG